ncbi:MAG: hypothetical protein ACREHE_07175 [Rhizomicrobium sp.]
MSGTDTGPNCTENCIDGPIGIEAEALQDETLLFEEETRLWSDEVRLASPPARPGLHELQAATALLLALSAAMLEASPPGSSEQRFLESFHSRVNKLAAEIRDQINPRSADRKK